MSRPEKPGRNGRKKRTLPLVTFASFIVVGCVLAINGLLLPWNEEGALFALYGASVGFVLALALSTLGLWFTRKDKNP